MSDLLKFIFITVMLTSCNSFNTTTVLLREPQTPVLPTTVSATPVAALTTSPTATVAAPTVPSSVVVRKGLCPRFYFPNPPAMPELPLDQISKLSKDDYKKADELLSKHIYDLRQHIKKLNSQIITAKMAYDSECKKYLLGQ